MIKLNIKKFLKDESAVTSIEYALIACLEALSIISVVGFTGDKLSKLFKEIGKTLIKLLRKKIPK